MEDWYALHLDKSRAERRYNWFSGRTMRIISRKKLRDFWENPDNANAESPLRSWYQTVKHLSWQNPADVKGTYNAADFVGNKVVFNIGGNKYRLVAVIDYEGQTVFVRFVLKHKDYEKGLWKTDAFAKDWKKRRAGPPAAAPPGRRKGKGGRRRHRR